MHLTVFTQFSTDSWVWAPKEDLARLELNSKFVIQMVTNWSTNVCRLCFKKKCLCCMWSKWFVQRQEKSCLKEYSHLIQLFIDLLIILIVFTKLGDQGPISQCEQLRVLKNKNKKPTETTQITCYVCHTQIWTNDNLFTSKKSLYKKF